MNENQHLNIDDLISQ